MPRTGSRYVIIGEDPPLNIISDYYHVIYLQYMGPLRFHRDMRYRLAIVADDAPGKYKPIGIGVISDQWNHFQLAVDFGIE